MTRKTTILFCENDHGTGDVCFPDVDGMDAFEVKQLFIEPGTNKSLRLAAKQAGWGRVNRADYCPGCMESM